MTRPRPEQRPGKPFRTRSGWRQYTLLGVILALVAVAVVIWIQSASSQRVDDDSVVGGATFSAYVEALRTAAVDDDAKSLQNLLSDDATPADAEAFIAEQGNAEKQLDYRMTEHGNSATITYFAQLTGDELPSFDVEWTGTRWNVVQ